jgi:ankyrin repeat protein
LLNHGVSVDITGIDGRIPLRAAACNGNQEVNRRLLSNGCSVHIARKSDLTALLAAADSVEVFCEFLKCHACVVIANKKCSELLKAAAEKCHVDVVCELLKIGANVRVSKKQGRAPFITAARTDIWRYCICC